ncbi:MAG: DEAD/DEAH box helicase [Evtepia sp.]|uniref:DEAD/DEAH box helicase n=1 Tax=Evtepia sp. TaxID=2773933 RepID=UPI002A757F5B|nr:DEAD/DEAH box helicase [Evtepia sp.]MDY3014918.1 DEAD/DEAH box helicase [Evtepia sp.]
MTRFASLGIEAPILSALTDYGYEEPTAIQEKAIPAGLAGRDVLGSAQTGTGKTCAFGVPILQRLHETPGHGVRALILTPTRELAIQIDENLRAYGKNLSLTEAVIFGGVGQAPQVEQLKRGVDILTATPGRLLDLSGQGLLDLSQVEIFVLDEADRMLDMGFIHDVRKVIAMLPEKKQTMFFSATLPSEIMDLVHTLLHDPVRAAAAPVSSPVEVIRQEVCLVDRSNKTALLLDILREEQVKNALVFTRTKHGADRVARDLSRRGVAAAAIHGNKSQTARQESLRKFKSGEIQVLVATDIAARGLDIEELSHVFNYNLPEVPETYIHRIGRTGRAGKGGTAISFCEYGEMPLLREVERLMKKPVPRREHPYPMENFDLPAKDAKGRRVHPEDEEARRAAREKAAARKKQAKQPAPQELPAPGAEAEAAPTLPEEAPKAGRKKKKRRKKAAAPAPAPVTEAAPPKEKPRRTYPHGKQNRGDLQAFLDAQPKEAEPVVLAPHRDPLKGEAIMDATARLLASKPVYHYYKPPKPAQSPKPGKKGKQKKEKEALNKPLLADSVRQTAQPAHHRKPPKKGAPVPAKKAMSNQERGPARSSSRNRVRIPPRVEPPKSRQKDSTEQKSLMKPFYINHD